MRWQFRIIVLADGFSENYEAHLTGQMCLIVLAEEFRDSYEGKSPPHSYWYLFLIYAQQVFSSKFHGFRGADFFL